MGVEEEEGGEGEVGQDVDAHHAREEGGARHGGEGRGEVEGGLRGGSRRGHRVSRSFERREPRQRLAGRFPAK